MTKSVIPAWVILKIVPVISWMRDWTPLNFRFLPDQWGLKDDACGCESCEKRRAKGFQRERKYF